MYVSKMTARRFALRAYRQDGVALPRVFLNGKFYAGAHNGVHRVADRLLRELNKLAGDGGAPSRWDMRLLLPAAHNWAPAFNSITIIPQRWGHSQLWEQLILPIVARNGVLASFANLAPSFHRNQLVMVHDAQFRLSPESYPPKLRYGYRALIPRGARASRTVLTVSDYARDSLATFGIASHDTTRVIYNGADHILEQEPDHQVRAAHCLKPGRYALLFGSAAQYKNVGIVFEAFARPDLADLALVIVGSTHQALLDAKLRPPPSAIFVGAVDDAALRSLYEGAQCLLYPSRTEGFGLPPVEAMLCGCPVVASPAGAVPEICRDAILYAGMDNVTEWVAAILSTAVPQLTGVKRAAGLVRAARFTWAAAGQRLASHLNGLIERAR